MNHNDLTLGLIMASIASLISFVVAVTMCLCCYKPKSADDDDDDSDLPKIATYQSVNDSDQLKRDDVKLLKKHPWQDPKTSSPHLTRKSIK
ncbi:hypothetical protein LSH36_9g08006 [Paralvinella palmiformis]|uniref:Uncharacterized protein n=1 Tax=Paralvinella palmiformis TaxID=53620 RepID=A0AAD9KD48_9ANNE|nr:hypothetical protein LSH36_9g08006 [Paralvinella palmiformis]